MLIDRRGGAMRCLHRRIEQVNKDEGSRHYSSSGYVLVSRTTLQRARPSVVFAYWDPGSHLGDVQAVRAYIPSTRVCGRVPTLVSPER
jgi:hypothetical protein